MKFNLCESLRRGDENYCAAIYIIYPILAAHVYTVYEKQYIDHATMQTCNMCDSLLACAVPQAQ